MTMPKHRLSISILVLPFMFAGCFAHVQPLPRTDPAQPSFQPLPDHTKTLVGIALSGGGSRAAYFGAAGLEALAQVRLAPGESSLLEQVSYLSSVSGGSVASSYFATRKPEAGVPVLNPDGSLTPTYRHFFDEYRTAMSKNLQWSMEWRQFSNVRWFNSNQRATSLSEALDAHFLNGITFDQFYEREKTGHSPRLILNTTLYNDGRRFVLTTVPRDDFHYDFIRKLQDKLEERERQTTGRPPKPLPKALEQAKDALNPLTFQDESADPRPIPLSKAVAASASFPFVIGPITAQVKGEHSYLHVGDGGLFDNQGTESLVQLFLKKLDDKKATRALVIAFDSSFPFWVKNDTLDGLKNGFDIFTEDTGRIVGIMEQRANAYQSMVWHILQSERIVLPDEDTIKVIVLRHTDAVWPENPQSALPDACRSDAAKLATKEEIRERLALIPTKLKLTDECDKALLREAAVKVVEQKKGEILLFLQGKTGS